MIVLIGLLLRGFFHRLSAVLAVINDLASLAVGVVWKTYDLPVPDQIPVDVRPAVFVGHVHQRVLGLLRILGVYQSHEVRYPVDMGVHTYGGYVHGIGSDACRGLPSHHREFHHLLGIGWNDSVIFIPEDLTAFHYRLSFLSGETGWADEFGDIIHISVRNRLYCRIFAEEVVRGLPGVVILGTLGEDGRDEDMEGVAGPLWIKAFRVPARICPSVVILRKDVQYLAHLFLLNHFKQSSAVLKEPVTSTVPLRSNAASTASGTVPYKATSS